MSRLGRRRGRTRREERAEAAAPGQSLGSPGPVSESRRGYDSTKPNVIIKLEQGEEPWVVDSKFLQQQHSEDIYHYVTCDWHV
ncbi:hypothetical protein E5288_WYG008448 [Bos mutus]|uniref:KRAB domain-containing protein n=1 Tax=Bos mutus TaxID=72004 RepID=A0A6B0S278_9CETA|nr:hypothetical protein [Bos mutus]